MFSKLEKVGHQIIWILAQIIYLNLQFMDLLNEVQM